MSSVYLALILLAGPCFGASTFAWKSVNTRGMGYVTGLVIHNRLPHDIYIRTDVGGAYRFDRGGRRWLPLLDRWGLSNSGVFGVESVAVDPSDAKTVYVMSGLVHEIVGGDAYDYAEVLESHDRGASWSPTGLGDRKLYIGANDAARGTTGERLAVDPNRQGRLYAGLRKDGLWLKDSDSPWIRASGVPAAAQPGVTFVVVDAASGAAANGATRRVYAGVSASGVWMSDNGGASWTNINGGENPTRAAVAGDGTLMVAFGGDEGARSGAVRRWRNGAWKDVTPFGVSDGYSGIAVHPAHPNTVIVCANHDQTMFQSADLGDTWARIYVGGSPDQPPYYATYSSGSQPNTAKPGGWGNGALAIDPLQPKRLLQTNGYGVVVTEDYTAAQTSWNWWMNNLEELVVQAVSVPPVDQGADLLSAVADMVGFRYASRDVVPSSTIAAFDWVAQATSIAYSAQHAQNVAFVGWDETNVNTAMTGVSADNGRTWKPFGDRSPGSGGIIAIAATDAGNMVWAPSRGAQPVYSTDGGQTWKPCRLDSGLLPPSWQLNNEWWTGRVLVADAIQSGTFYYYVQGDVYSSTNGGATWAKVGTVQNDNPPVQWTIRVNLTPHPSHAGEVWVALQRNTNQPLAFPLLRTADGGKTFSAVPGLAAVNYMAFGKGNAPDEPFLYAHGRSAGADADAIYKSEDSAATWIAVSDPAQSQFGNITALEGDLRTKDLVYVGTGGRGISYGFGPGSGLDGPRLAPEGIRNAAGYQGGSVAPGEILTLFGSGLGPDATVSAGLDEAGFLSTVAGDTQVLFDGLPAPMVYASASQTSVIAPYGLAGRTGTSVQVSYHGVPSLPVAMPVSPAVPALFTLDSSGTGPVVAVNAATEKLNSPSAPVKRGDYLILYATGDGQTAPEGFDGLIVTGSPGRTAAKVTATLGGVTASVDYSGAAPYFVMGVTQINLKIPDNAPTGPEVELVLNVGGTVSQSKTTVAVE